MINTNEVVEKKINININFLKLLRIINHSIAAKNALQTLTYLFYLFY